MKSLQTGGYMFGIGSFEFLVVVLVAVIALGPDKLPKVMRVLTRIMSEFRRVKTDFQRTMNAELAQQEYRQMQKEAKSEQMRQHENGQPDAGSQVDTEKDAASAAAQTPVNATSSPPDTVGATDLAFDASPTPDGVETEEPASPRITEDELQKAVRMGEEEAVRTKVQS